MKKILIVIGTRPNFIKVTQFKKLAAKYPQLEIKLLHTGQHSDEKMAEIFFRQFDILPDYYLNIEMGSPIAQISEILVGIEKLVKNQFSPDLMMVVGDVNSTMAAAIAANKLGIRLAHLESGLRSFDQSMPEEHNRVVTDKLSDIYFVTEKSGIDNLLKEGVFPDKIKFVGNTMIDTMVAFEMQIESSPVLTELSLNDSSFVLITMHRPATVDSRSEFEKFLSIIDYVSAKHKIIFPVHPRTQKRAVEFGLMDRMKANPNLICTDPLDYFSFQKCIKYCRFIITDSGGIQEESTFRQKPCITLRANTERPVTVDVGSNTLLPFELSKITGCIAAIEEGTYKKGVVPELWDGKSTERILQVLSGL